jgi:tryptophan synthase alpha chain
VTRAGIDRLAAAIQQATAGKRPALAAYVTGGHPNKERFPAVLDAVAACADIVEVGIPFTDPMADGVTIQASSRTALESGATLDWILAAIQSVAPKAPAVLMSYYNPLLAFGVDRLADRAQAADVAGVIVPDLPLEESRPLHAALDGRDIALIQLVSPVTPEDRLRRLCEASRGFVYAVTTTGITGGRAQGSEDVFEYLDRVRRVSPLPVLAGFGIRSADQVRALTPHVDGVIVGSALIEQIERGGDPTAFLMGLRGVPTEA